MIVFYLRIIDNFKYKFLILRITGLIRILKNIMLYYNLKKKIQKIKFKQYNYILKSTGYNIVLKYKCITRILCYYK